MWYLTIAILVLAVISAIGTILVILQRKRLHTIIVMLVDLGWRDGHGQKP